MVYNPVGNSLPVGSYWYVHIQVLSSLGLCRSAIGIALLLLLFLIVWVHAKGFQEETSTCIYLALGIPDSNRKHKEVQGISSGKSTGIQTQEGKLSVKDWHKQTERK